MKATLAGGCFWCTEAVFQRLKGINTLLPGYMGGHTENPTYEEVCTGKTNHAEVIQIDYNEDELSFRDLLGVFFKTHDPTTLNRQGNDIGTQYRSEIFYHNDLQKEEAERFIAGLTAEGVFDKPIVTKISPAETFYEAEDYHTNYFLRNPNQPYCVAVVKPKVDKFIQAFE
ncbi:peptide-methionine (S)-S-oxide reductase MsrA [Albibacterium sp.]|uniref:peptide-methionine (S)-S-oxide reductase MsrA n=1 Tax=Albibacterium sp. TaxID=2952885 RepID=UPI002C9A68BD|nr:peptide-methionine (S)-S-oxide reductase MsrA [Albibacterium sp.]HUH17727.1 peptide-methionine (S)-S-oxide reductase MsrA [Albibacterium sp.]